jgi:hypothetical protein
MAKAKCAFCGRETELYVNGVPICLECDREKSTPPPPKPPAKADKLT